MSSSSTSSSDRYDAIRAQNPDIAISLYGLVPGGDVTLEVITPDGQSFTWSAATASDALALAFPQKLCPNTGLPCVPGCDQKTCAGLHTPLNEWPDTEPAASIFQQPTPPVTGSIFD